MSAIGVISSAPLTDVVVGCVNPFGYCAATAMVANQADLVGFTVSGPRTVSKAVFEVQTTGSNFDMGIYDAAGNRLGSTGATAVAAAGTQTVNLTAPVALRPGVVYFAALSADSTTAKGYSSSQPVTFFGATMRTGFRFATSFPLPSTLAIAGATISASRVWLMGFLA